MIQEKTILQRFRRAASPVLLSTLMAGCASTVQRFDADSCMEWSESEAQLLVLRINSRTASAYQNACIEGRAGAQVTLIGNDGKNLNPVSAAVGKNFLTIVREKAAKEHSEREQQVSLPTGDDPSFAPKPAEGMTFSEKILHYFNYYLGAAGFSEGDINTALQKAKTEAEAKTNALPEGCVRNQNGLVCK